MARRLPTGLGRRGGGHGEHGRRRPDRHHDWGIEVVFGLPGDGINGVMEALRKRKDTIRFVHARHEESAAFMACGYA
jgi:hypothetical protein